REGDDDDGPTIYFSSVHQAFPWISQMMVIVVDWRCVLLIVILRLCSSSQATDGLVGVFVTSSLLRWCIFGFIFFYSLSIGICFTEIVFRTCY
uniref:Uncharacterized protein n=1 Tax=Aegilops tauschii subsp. strangulata TaxID=200361 RepID=A0A453G314_AEGTS